MSQALIHFDRARQELELAASIDEVKDIRDKAEALRHYVKQRGESLEMQNLCAEIKIRAERRAGEMLEEREGHPPGPLPKDRSRDATYPVKLKDLGITKSESSRWQLMASLPLDMFEDRIAQAKEGGKELTSGGIQAYAKALKKASGLKVMADMGDTSGCAVSTLENLINKGQRFKTIYADPPWKYGNQATRASTDNHYVTMTVDEIAALPISELVHDEAHLHLWTTNAFLFDSKAIIEAWGFEFKSALVWVKPQMGIGNYWRVSHEYLLLGVRGGLRFADRAQKSWIQADRTKHSKKPEQVRDMIQLVSPGPYLELFGRQTCPGWTVWGNEIERTLFNEGCFSGDDFDSV